MIPSKGLARILREHFMACLEGASTFESYVKETLTETEQILTGSIFDAYKKQYRTKSTLRYNSAVSLEKKFIRMKLIQEVKP